MIKICIPVITRYDLLEKLIDSLSEKDVKFFIVNNGKKSLEKEINIEEFSEEKCGDRISVIRSEFNLGVAASWNFFLQNISPNEGNYWIISNDDVEFLEDTLDILVKEAPKHSMVLPKGGSWSLFSIHENAVKEVGYFDENFYPAYFEDNDYHHRLKLKNMSPHIENSLEFKHFGSATLKGFSKERTKQHHREFKANRDYFKKKWGYVPG
jgi:GT2 family glycosyltransferase